MHIGLVCRSNSSLWGGDLQLLLRLKDALEQMGHRVTLGASAYDVLVADVVLLTNSMIYQMDNMEMLLRNKVPYFVLCFHEDIIQYYLPSNGFAQYVKKCMEGSSDYSIERLYENPHAVYYFSDLFPRGYYFIFDLLKSAQCCIANSAMEERTIRRDCPFAKTAVVSLPHAEWIEEDDGGESFFDALGLQDRPYLLQVGRLETRKNQLASLIATRNLGLPLVLVAPESHQGWYEQLCVEAAVHFRKAPVLILSQNLSAFEKGAVRVIPMPGGKLLPKVLMHKLYEKARLYVHPSFCELPGFVFFEAMKKGVPIVASEWCAIQDYLVNAGPEDIQYVLPFDVASLQRKVEQFLMITPKKNAVSEPCFERSTLEYAQDIVAIIRTFA